MRVSATAFAQLLPTEQLIWTILSPVVLQWLDLVETLNFKERYFISKKLGHELVLIYKAFVDILACVTFFFYEPFDL